MLNTNILHKRLWWQETIMLMPSDGGGGDSGGDGPGGDGGDSGDSGDHDGTDAMGNNTETTQETADTQGYGNNTADSNNTGEGSSDGSDTNGFGVDRSVGENTPMGQEASDLDAQNAGFDGFGAEQQAADNSGYSIAGVAAAQGIYSYTADYNAKTGITTLDRVGMFGGYDSHIGSTGNMFGAYDEMAIDALEVLGIEVTQANINTAQSLAELGMAIALGLPAVAIGVRAAKAANDMALSTGQISQDTHDKIGMGIAVVGFAISAKGSLDAFGAGLGAIDAGYGALGAVAIGISAIGLAEAIGQLSKAAEAAGLSNADMENIGTGVGLDGSMGDGGGSFIDVTRMVVDKLTQEVNRRSRELNNISSLLGQGEADTYDYLAGGKYYSIKMAGEPLMHPSNKSYAVDARKKSLLVAKDVIINNLQTDSIEPLSNLLPLPVAELEVNESYIQLLNIMKSKLQV